MAENADKKADKAPDKTPTNHLTTEADEVTKGGRGGWKGNQASLDALARAREEKKARAAEAASQPVHEQPAEEPAKESPKDPELPDPGPVAIEDGMPEMLWWMNHVLKRPERTDVEEGQKACRKWLRENVSAFMAARTKLESDWLEYKKAKVLAAAPVSEEEVDEPLERVIDLVAEALREKKWLKEDAYP